VDDDGPAAFDPPPEPWRPPRRTDPETLKRGSKLSMTGGIFAFVCWALWAASSRGRLSGPLIAFAVVLGVAIGIFMLTRLLGRLILEERFGRIRHGATGAHAVTGLFLVVAGLAYLQRTSWVGGLTAWFRDVFG
jgi:hypothetical protein